MRRTLPALLAVVIVLLAGAALVIRARVERAGTAAPVRVRVSVEQWRTDEVAHTVQIAMHNDGPRPVRVERVELLAPSFAGLGPVDVDAPLPVGGLRVDVTVPYGTGRCAAGEPDPASAPARVGLRVRTHDGAVRDVRLPLAHPNPMLDKLLGQDCRQEMLGRALLLRFGPWTTAPDGSLHGTVRADLAGSAAAVTVHEVAGNILFRLRPVPVGRATPLGTVTAGQPTLVVPVVAAVDRCSGHVLGEIKKPYLFPAYVSLADGPKQYTEIAVGDADRAALDALVPRQCTPAGLSG